MQVVPSEATLVGTYDHRLIVLSVLIAMLAAYAALDFAGRVTAAWGRMRIIWLAGGAAAMGMVIWSTHYIGMLAHSLPAGSFYNWPTVLMSLLATMQASAFTLFVVHRSRYRRDALYRSVTVAAAPMRHCSTKLAGECLTDGRPHHDSFLFR